MARVKTATPFEESTTAPQLAEIQEPAHSEIEMRAYYRYLERGCLDGFDLDDWLAAEAELRPDYAVLARSA